MNEIEKLQPTCIWRNFFALTQVPRPSGHVEKIQQFLLDFAKKIGIEAFQDPAGNIVMRKPATPGMENRNAAPRWVLTTVWAWQPSWQSWRTTPSSTVPSRA